MENEDIELIERYHQHLLNKEELEDFERRLAVDEAFRSLVNDLKILTLGVRQAERKSNVSVLREFEKTLPPIALSTTGKVRSMYAVRIAASFLLLAVLSSLLYVFYFSNNLFTEYFDPYPSFYSERGTLQDSTSELSRGLSYYDQGNYEKALVHLKQAYQDNKSAEILFYIGNARLAGDSPAEAQKIFSELSSTPSELRVPSLWYLSLSYLKMKNNEEARTVLEELSKTNSSYSIKADELLKKLK